MYVDGLIDIWSMRPPPGTPEGDAWEAGARQGWEWAVEACAREIDGWKQAAVNVGSHKEQILAYANAAAAVRAIDDEE